jgi:hypothetical protein
MPASWEKAGAGKKREKRNTRKTRNMGNTRGSLMLD